MSLKNYKNGFGFTTIELVATIAIAAIVVTIVTLSFGKINDRQALDKSALNAVSVLNEARNLTLSSLNAERYGVRVLENSLVILPTYATTTLNSLTGIRNVNLNGGGNTVYFDKLTGRTSQSGTFEIYLKAATTTFRTININGNGVAQ